MAEDYKLMIVFEKDVQESASWLWKKIIPKEFITFSISDISCMKILDDSSEEIEKIKFGYNQNRLTFDGDDSNVYVIAIIKDFSKLPSGKYNYEILIESLIDDLKIEDSGELEIING